MSKKSAIPRTDPSLLKEFLDLTAVHPSPSGPIYQVRRYGRADHDKPWQNDCEGYAYLLDAVGIRNPQKGTDDRRFRRKIDVLRGDYYPEGLQSQFVLNDHIGIVEFSYDAGWSSYPRKQNVEEVDGSYVCLTIGRTYPSIELPTQGRRYSPDWVKRLICEDTREWRPPQEARFIGESTWKRNPVWSIKAGDLSGAIFLTAPESGVGNLPVLLLGTHSGTAIAYDIRQAFTDKSLMPSASVPNAVTVPFSKVAGMEGKLPDVIIRRGRSTVQMEMQGLGTYFIEAQTLEEGRLLSRFPSDWERNREGGPTWLQGSFFTAWSFGNSYWFDGWVTRDSLIGESNAINAVERQVRFDARGYGSEAS